MISVTVRVLKIQYNLSIGFLFYVLPEMIKLLNIYTFNILWRGKLAKAWGLGGLFKAHSKLV